MDRNAPRKRKATSLGSGIVIDETGYIVTNNHVIGQADQIQVVFQDGKTFDRSSSGANDSGRRNNGNRRKHWCRHQS